ncbi:MAG: PQ-loop repeat-containing protein [Alphaproteobacteria bacterium]|nr:PQ-loop repeat-containing protein [Alphaproteobacteria bacterium]MBQ9540688.1 PQ-loop repeat-containing protein [Alphaproteobacteria bacterium]
MKETIAIGLLSVYSVLEFVAYIPQIVKILKTKHADDLSLMSWFVWIATDLSYLGYVLLETPQFGVIFIALLDLVFIMTVFMLTMYYQKHNKRKKVRR